MREFISILSECDISYHRLIFKIEEIDNSWEFRYYYIESLSVKRIIGFSKGVFMSAKTNTDALPSGIKYHQVQQKSSHNSYANLKIDIRQQIQKSNVYSIEVDLHQGKGDVLDSDWAIYHVGTDTRTNIDSFKYFLTLCQIIHGDNPNHEVITVFLDMKEDFAPVANHTADQLDKMINEWLPGKVYTPSMLANENQTLVEAAVNEQWPTLDALRGRFIFALTNGSFDDDESILNHYVENGAKAKSRVAFIAPDIDRIEQIGDRDYVVFYNIKSYNSRLGIDTANNFLISRVYEIDNEEQWNAAVEHKINHIAVDFIGKKKYPKYVLEDANGRPFQSLTGTT
jgi:hypothetical protein